VSKLWEETESEILELRLLQDAIFLKYGYDFRDYSQASLKRRVFHRMKASGLSNVSEAIHLVLTDPDFFNALLCDLSINVTEMFRDPDFFEAIRNQLLPELMNRPFLKIWHAGCATGEEVYAMAILLYELKILDRTKIFATDINAMVVDRAKQGVFPMDRMRMYTSNYQRAGGTRAFANYYTAQYDSAVMKSFLKKNIIFADHNLVGDSGFGEMDLIVCRNVLIYFNRNLQDRVIRLFSDNLGEGGFLCVGNRESIRFAKASEDFEEFNRTLRIYRRKPTTRVGSD
jgi:chemotaxis protein methyltransferase CheR